MKSLNQLASNIIDDLYVEEAMKNNPPEETPYHKRKMSLTAPITTVFMFDAIEMITLIVHAWSYRNNGTSYGISLRRPRSVTP